MDYLLPNDEGAQKLEVVNGVPRLEGFEQNLNISAPVEEKVLESGEQRSGLDFSSMPEIPTVSEPLINHISPVLENNIIPAPFSDGSNPDINIPFAKQMENVNVSPVLNTSMTPTIQIEEKKVEEIKTADTTFMEANISDRIYQIETSKIVPNPYQPRREFSEDAILELASSIQEYGVLEPLIVKKVEKENVNGIEIEYQLIAGERRLRASKKAGLRTVPAIIRDFENKCLELEVALVENVQREDLGPIMKARAYAQLINEFGYTQEMVGRRVGKSREAVANGMRLLQLPFEAQKALDEGKISESHARALLLLPNMEKQRALLGEVLSKQLSSREAEIIARQFLEKQNIKVGTTGRKRLGDSVDPKDLELREKLESMFDAKVMIKRKGERGEISIFFYSEDELEHLVSKLSDSSEKLVNKAVEKLNNI